jgi:hypothetical protein
VDTRTSSDCGKLQIPVGNSTLHFPFSSDSSSSVAFEFSSKHSVIFPVEPFGTSPSSEFHCTSPPTTNAVARNPRSLCHSQ